LNIVTGRLALTRALLLFTALTACGDGPFDRGAPDALPAPPRGNTAPMEAPAPGVSTVTVPITIPAAALQASVNQQVPQVVLDVKDEPVEKQVVADIRVERAGDVQVAVGDGEIRMDVPVSMRVRPRPKFARGKKGSIGVVTYELVVQIHLAPTLTPDWSLQANARVDHRWVVTPKLELGPLRVDVQKKTDKKLALRFAEVAADIDADLAKIPLRADLARAWAGLGQPLPLSADPPLWLRVHPSSLYVQDPVASGGAITLAFSATGAMEVVLGEAPAAAEAPPLPPRGQPPADRRTRLTLPLRLEWGALVAGAEPQVEGRTETIQLTDGSEATATIVDLIDIYPSGESLAVGVDVAIATPVGDVAARAWLLGRPELEGHTLRLRDFDFSAESDAAWIDALGSASQSVVVEQLSELLVFPLEPELQRVRAQVNANLSGASPRDGVVVNGAVESLELSGLGLGEDALLLNVELVARLALAITSLPPPPPAGR